MKDVCRASSVPAVLTMEELVLLIHSMTNENEWKKLCELVENERDLDKLSKHLNRFARLLNARREAQHVAGPAQARSDSSEHGLFKVNRGKHAASPHR